MFRKFATVFLLLPLAVSADFKSGGDAYQRGDYETAAKEFLPLAENGDHRAMYALGSMYSAGHGVPQDYAEALKWFQRAAKYGRPDAEYKLGLMYFNGLGTEKDERKAINWFGKAAKKGLNTAQFRVGEMYAAGLGVQQNDVKAYAWLSVALEQGLSETRAVLDTVTARLNPEQLAEAQELAESYRNLYARKQFSGQ
jgi:TPR repeat protein